MRETGHAEERRDGSGALVALRCAHRNARLMGCRLGVSVQVLQRRGAASSKAQLHTGQAGRCPGCRISKQGDGRCRGEQGSFSHQGA